MSSFNIEKTVMNFHFPFLSSQAWDGDSVRSWACTSWNDAFLPNLDELAELESPSVSTEYHAELGRL